MPTYTVPSACLPALQYSLDYARTRLANDNKSAKKGGSREFNGACARRATESSVVSMVGRQRHLVRLQSNLIA